MMRSGIGAKFEIQAIIVMLNIKLKIKVVDIQ